MKHTIVVRNAAYLLASLVTVLSLTAVQASAQHGSDDTAISSSQAASNPDDSGSAQEDTPNAGAGQETGSESENDNSGVESGKLRDTAQQLLQTTRKDGKEHTTAQRQLACNQREHSITTRTANFGAAAQRHLDVFNSIFAKVQAFQTDKHLNVSNYDALVAAATAKQSTAQSAVDALKALNVPIDCTQSDPAGSVATVKAAVSDARTALQAYRSAIKDVIVALKGASTAQTSTDGSKGE